MFANKPAGQLAEMKRVLKRRLHTNHHGARTQIANHRTLVPTATMETGRFS
jgi:hypothetical protein